MAVTILGEHISLIRPKKINKSIVPRQWRRDNKASRPKTIKHTKQRLIEIAHEMGYLWKGES